MHGCLLGGNQTRISGSPPELSTMEKILDKRKCVASAFPANANHSRRSNRERRCSIPFSACAAGCDEAAGHDSDSSDQKLAGNDGSDVDYNPCHILGLSLPFLGLRSHSHPRFTPRSCTLVEQIILGRIRVQQSDLPRMHYSVLGHLISAVHGTHRTVAEIVPPGWCVGWLCCSTLVDRSRWISGPVNSSVDFNLGAMRS